ncbi:hypothetical protein CTZ27_32005 [Streptomyces griseocarneus]|nr:hypothetical protein CTZ27_32005 [Streptomyces griseocarneus]
MNDELRRLYEREFLPVNRRFKEMITAWQLQGSDPERFEDLMPVIRDVLRRCAAEHMELASYPDRFEKAAMKVTAGEYRWLSGVFVDSCHTVWFELHARLMRLLGISRGQEETDGTVP